MTERVLRLEDRGSKQLWAYTSLVVRTMPAATPRSLTTAAATATARSAQHDTTSRAKYEALRARGHSHARALRSVVDRLLYVACVMLEKRTLFDPSRAQKKNAAA